MVLFQDNPDTKPLSTGDYIVEEMSQADLIESRSTEAAEKKRMEIAKSKETASETQTAQAQKEDKQSPVPRKKKVASKAKQSRKSRKQPSATETPAMQPPKQVTPLVIPEVPSGVEPVITAPTT